MQSLDSLTKDALDLGGGAVSLTATEAEAARQLQVCNACRYWEGFCAMFPAMTQRLMFEQADVHYLANLCHNCGACLHACQYAPPRWEEHTSELQSREKLVCRLLLEKKSVRIITL